MTLAPLRFIAQEPVLVDGQDVVHSTSCTAVASNARWRPAGTVFERQRAPDSCPRCFAGLHLMLGRTSSGQ